MLHFRTSFIYSDRFSLWQTGIGCIRCLNICVTLKATNIPEELLPDPEGILIGGGRCFTPFPKTDVWTSGEILSPCIGQMWFSWVSNRCKTENSNSKVWLRALSECQRKNDLGKQITELTVAVLHVGRMNWCHLVSKTLTWLMQYSPHLYRGTEAPVQCCLSCGTSWPDTLHLSRTHLCTD